jgi:hypothetical protein
MAAVTMTHTGPIGLDQVNTTYYVWANGTAGFDSVQQAVNFINTYNAGLGQIVIVHGSTFGENIGAVNGGGTGIVIIDQRQGVDQRYRWNGTQFVPQDYGQLSGFVAEGMPSQYPASVVMGYAPAGNSGNGSGNIVVTANPTKGMPSLNLTLVPEDGTGLFTFLRMALDPAGNPRVQSTTMEVFSSPLYPDIYNMWIGQTPDTTGDKGMYIWAQPSQNAIDFQGETANATPTYDQTIRLNYLGGDVKIGPAATVNADGDITAAGNLSVANAAITGDAIVGGELQADSATFNSCSVDNSPVRTFDNTPDGPGEGMVWPPIGIAVSLGDHWQNPSIDPAALATWPAVGIPVSSGSAWGTSIDPTTVPRLNAANIFTQPQTITSGGLTLTTDPNAAISINGQNVANATPPVARMNLGVNGVSGTKQEGTFIFYTSNPTANSTDQLFQIEHYAPDIGLSASLLGIDGNGTLTCASAKLRLGNRTPVSTWASGSPNLNSDGSSIVLNAAGPNAVYLNYDQGTGGTIFGNGASAQIGSIDKNGNANFTGSVTAGTYLTAGETPLIPVGGSRVYGCYLYNATAAPTWTRLQCCGDGGSRGMLVVEGVTPGGGATKPYANFGTTGTASGSTIFDTLAVTTLTAGDSASFSIGEDPSVTSTYGFGLVGFKPNAGTSNMGILSIYASKANTGWGDTHIQEYGGNVMIGIPGGGSATTVYGSFTVENGPKSFRTSHPLDDSLYLIHSCLEGPECGVYYRGEATTANGSVEVTLPSYFEGLTLPSDRSVQLTQIADDVPVFSQLAASRVAGGKFRIFSSEKSVSVHWEVKAIRADIEPLEVTTRKELTVNANPTAANPSIPGADRSGTSEAGEHKPKKVRT